MLDSAGPDEPVRYILNVLAPAFYHKYLEAVVGVEMDVKRGNNVMERLVLHVRESMLELARMVIIDYRYGPDRLVRSRFPFPLNERVSDHVTYCLGPGGVAFAGYECVELLDQLAFYGYAESRYTGHVASVLRFLKK